MNNHPPAGSFETQTKGFAQPRMVNIVTQRIPLYSRTVTVRRWRSLSLR